MKFDNLSLVEQTTWDMRLADLPRAENRTIINRQFNGDPPFDPNTAEENNVQINRSDLSGVNAMSQARRQWMQAFLKPGNLFTCTYDIGPRHKRQAWGHTVTHHANRVLRSSRRYVEQVRGTGGNTMLHGVAPAVWLDRRTPVCRILPIGSCLIPSETDIDFENLDHIAFFQEWTPAQLWQLTHGPKTDPGWNMALVDSQWKYVHDQYLKQPNATAFQYMPERIEELVKQDLGFWGSDAVPTIDVWDFYFREKGDGEGWYRRVFLDWDVGSENLKTNSKKPDSRTPQDLIKNEQYRGFLYNSGKRKFSNSLNEFFHCQVGDCSAVFPQKYHSIRSLGWMLWGVCDLLSRLHCKFSEALFEQLMWFFQVANNNDLTRLRKADFIHFGVIPQGTSMIKAADRYQPPPQLVQMGFDRFRQLIAEAAAGFTQSGPGDKEMTATQTMAIVNSVNALVSGLFTLCYTYEEFKDREDLRRLCIKNNPDRMARDFRQSCLEDNVPPEMLDVDKMIVQRERTLGGGNKTLEMAQVKFLQDIRKNLGPDGQRKVDHLSIESATDDARLAEELAPVDGQKIISSSMRDAQNATDRLMRGLPVIERPDMVYEDYVKVWIADLTILIMQKQKAGGMATAEDIAGYQNIAAKVVEFLKIMSEDPDEQERVRQYQDQLKKLMNLVKAFAQRLMAQMKAAQQAGTGADPKDAAKAQAMVIQARTKAQLAEQSHAQKTAQRQVAFEMEQQRKDRESNATLRRMRDEHHYNLLTGAIEQANELAAAGNGKPENQ